ncbi:hypothetical protein CBER1_04048 [Cercospora berteroae]|uniref:Uncharacterized protein n=1 Tax=Cercospora berteroae TaxID=357750 RepID=A0A2S6C4Z9_9PEZI|nr:hypothetical protein CBER1_04048 [Cercospora berteroae]
MESSTPPPRCMFFEISAELRNAIYEQVLIVSDCYDPIRLRASTGLEVPALLQVCRQIRNEAAQMYFKENHIELELVKCNPNLLYHWVKMASRYVGSSCVDGLFAMRSVDYSTEGTEDRNNILQWCRLVRDGELEEWDRDGDVIKYGFASVIVVSGHQLALQMRSRPWEEFVAAFDILYVAVENACEQTLAVNRY